MRRGGVCRPEAIGDRRAARASERRLSTTDERSTCRLPALPVVAVTAPGRGTVRNDLLRAGVIDFLSQPIDPVELGCRIRTLHELRRLRERTPPREGGDEAQREFEPTYRTILETAEEGVWMIDVEARTTFVNHRMAEMLGVGVEEMVGRLVTDFMDEASQKPRETAVDAHSKEHDGNPVAVVRCCSRLEPEDPLKAVV